MVKLLGKDVGETGYGLMGLTWRAQPVAHDQAFEAMRTAVAKGALFWNGGEFYGDIEKGPNSLTLLNAYFTKYPEDREKVIIGIKGAVRPGWVYDGSPEGIRASVDNCLRQLPPSVKKLDIFELARIDQTYPIENQMRTLDALVKEGKIGGIGLSEVSAATIKRAAAVAPVAVVEIELSLWETTYMENNVLPTCAELGIPVVAYSPLGRGFLTGEIKSPADLPEGDPRHRFPRFAPENFSKNLELVDKLQDAARRKGCTPAQLALAWLRNLSNNKTRGYSAILPIPGATTAARVTENCVRETLTSQEEADLTAIIKSITVAGDRYHEHGMKMLEL